MADVHLASVDEGDVLQKSETVAETKQDCCINARFVITHWLGLVLNANVPVNKLSVEGFHESMYGRDHKAHSLESL